MHHAAPEEARQIEHDHLDPRIRCRQRQRPFDIARLILSGRCLGAHQQLERIDVALLLDDVPVEFEEQRAVLDLARRRPCGERGIEQREEQQQENQRQGILHAHQQFPDLARERHEFTSLSIPMP
nr:hypothetical protein [Novosphingobium sp. ST904]